MHLFFRVDYAAWDLLENAQRIEAKTALASLVQEISATPLTQLLTFSTVSPKAHLGFMLLTRICTLRSGLRRRLGPALPEFSFRNFPGFR